MILLFLFNINVSGYCFGVLIQMRAFVLFLSGKVHGSLARAGKVKGQTPKVEAAEDKAKNVTGRAKKRLQYNRRFVDAAAGFGGKKVGPNNQAARQAREAAAAE
jgi:small subunit ribosomal protein S30e